MYDRIIGLILLLVATFVPVEMVSFIVRPDVQLIAGTIIVLYLVLKDAIAGFIAGIALLIVYFRVYAEKLGISFQDAIGMDKLGSIWGSNSSEPSSSMPYITPQHLESAQSNVVDPASLGAEMKGVLGVYGEEVYGAQGMDKEMPGFSSALGEEVRD